MSQRDAASDKFFTQAATIVLVGLAYWVGARLAMLLALPPGYATAVWPPAGVALGAALIWKRRGLAGAAIGAIAVNLLRLKDWPGVEQAISPLLQALGICAGVVLQASAGSWLIRRAIGQPIALVRDHHVILFMLVGGPLACVISATVGVTTLALAGTLSQEEIAFSWFVWWVGDSIGVLTFAPMVLMFFSEPAELWRHRRWSIGLPMAVTFAATVAVFLAANQSEAHQDRERLERRADAISSSFQSRVGYAANLLRACNGFYQSSALVTRQEFSTFAGTLLADPRGVKSLSSVQRVDDADRDVFEARIRAEGVPDFQIKELQGESTVAPSARRPVYFAVTSIEPEEENRWALGMDVLTRPATAHAIETALDSGGIVVSERVRLLRDTKDQFGVVVYLLRFAPGAALETLEQRRAALVGLNGAVFRIADLVGSSLTPFDVEEVALNLTDVTDPDNDQLLFADTRDVANEANDRTSRVFEIGGRQWKLQITRIQGYSLAHQRLRSWTVLAGGLILTGLLGGLLMILTGRATLIASVVRERTRELSQTNAELAREQAVSQTMMQELKASRDAAEEADKTKSAFLANMSHEIRTPMTAILGYTDLFIDPMLPAAVRNGYAEVIRRNGEHLMEVVNDILDISKIEAGKLAVEMIPCWIDEIVRDVQTMMQPRAHQKGIEFSVEWKGDTARPIRSDPMRVRQILINLVSNAIKFTERGGVTLRVERHFDFIDMTVIDTGIGMSPAQIARIFEPFTQGDSTMTRRFGGTGLGLAISRHLSRLLGGELEVRSELNSGSTFQLRLPAVDLPEHEAQRRPSPRAATKYEVPAAIRGKRIVLAEDSADVREFLRQLLVHAQFDVTAVANGQELLDAALHARSGAGSGHGAFDLFLVDMQMPVVDGYEATRRLRAAGITAPIIAVTAHALESDRQACLDAGCSDYLRKPVRRSDLLQSVASALGVAGGEAELQAITNPIRSELEADPIIADLLPVFIGELERYCVSLREAAAAQNVESIRQLLHNVKGAASTFGYPQLSELAAAASAEMRVRPWGDGFQLTLRQLFDLSARVRQSAAVGAERGAE